ncbi:MAG: hypothetical protein LW629_03155 [Burkholderiales bacterium]|jgi:hypothetical protein|nr:hypothetical protein [Burkholderiales bacterium]
MSTLLAWPADPDLVLRLYARLAQVSARILEFAQNEDWEAVAQEQDSLVEVSAQLANLREDDAQLTALQKTSRILYLTAALEDQRLATEHLSQRSSLLKKNMGSLGRNERLKQAYFSAENSAQL